jgi:hypothetical protein
MTRNIYLVGVLAALAFTGIVASQDLSQPTRKPDDPGGAADEPPAAGPASPVIQSVEQLYAVTNLLKVELFMEEAAWDQVRYSWRGDEPQLVDGRWVIVRSDYEHQRANVVINGVRCDNVGVRKKGFLGSLSAQRPALKLKFDKYVKEQAYLGLRELTLNNNLTDPAQIRQQLAYEWFRRAGLAAPRCNLARVYLNGKFLGVYSNVEPIGTGFLSDRFGTSAGRLYESTRLDFQPGAVERFEAKAGTPATDRSSLRELARLLEDVPAADVAALAGVVDLDQFLKYWVTEMMLGLKDGYAGNRNNFFVHQHPETGLLQFLPWGTDGAFAHFNPTIAESAPKLIQAKGRLCAALYSHPVWRQRYLDLVAKQLADWWDEPALLMAVNRAAALVQPHVHLPGREFDQAIAHLKDYIRSVAPQIEAELRAPPAKWLVTLPEYVPPVQSVPPSWAGSMQSNFLLPFSRFDPSRPTLLKTDALHFVWRGEPVKYPLVGGTAGYASPNPAWFDDVRLWLATQEPASGRTVWFSFSIDRELLARERRLKLHRSQVMAWSGITEAGRPGFLALGNLLGTLEVELVEIDGVPHLRGAIDAWLISDHGAVEF